MTILIANIGTSDLAVKPEGIDYYLPIGFDRNEPNSDKAIAELNAEEMEIWNQRKKLISNFCKKLEVKCHGNGNPFSFRELTNRLWEEYQKDSGKKEWHSRLSPGRIWGVINAAVNQTQVKTIYLFVTDQNKFNKSELKEEEPKINPGYQTDSIHLFYLLKLWVSHEFGSEIQVKSVIIPQEVPVIDLDGLLAEYYRFFTHGPFEKTEKIFISVKGGTPQMQTALRVQAMSSDLENLIYLEPDLSIKKLLGGEPSHCRKISYWQYQRSQKYQSIKQLLNKRWDFDGARVILEQWKITLEELKKEKIENHQDIQKSQERIESIIKALNMAVGYLNLDAAHAENQANDTSVENQKISSLGKLTNLTENYDHLLNLYTQCSLFWELDRIADFLTRMGSFYEETLHTIIIKLGAEKYFNRDEHPDDWYLDPNELKKDAALLDNFSEIEKKYKKWINDKDKNKDNRFKTYKLPGRPSKLNFVEALIKTNNGNVNAWQELVEAMKKLDYWAEKRNQLIHSAKGISKQRMQQEWDKDQNLGEKGQMKNKKIERYRPRSCSPDEIREQMANIARSTLTLIGTSAPSLIMFPDEDYLNPNTNFHYLYSDIRAWAIEQLTMNN